MTYYLDLDRLDNPYVQVVWEDFSENFTQEKIKSVKQYFQKKYNTVNVEVIPKTKVSEEVESNVDISFNILDSNYQVELIKSYLKSRSLDDTFDKVMDLDSVVRNRLSLSETDVTPFKKWYIKNIEFSNFLSYGDNQKIDFDKCNGINVIESTPSNFGGKTIISCDLLLFLFFNETTKTTKSEEIFNRFTDKNRVFVKGEIRIDGDDYVIVRQIERKKGKNGEWTVKTDLDFFKKLPNGDLQNFTGEQRRETENFIKNSIGSKEDFLMTILTTSNNLEELIDSKPTARGQVLSRFMGLDFLKRKEETAKEIYSDFSSSMISKVYNSEKLKQDNEEYKTRIDNLESENTNSETELTEVKNKIVKGQEYRDDLLKSKHTDIDKEISLLSPDKVTGEILSLESQRTNVEHQMSLVNVVEPSSYYHEDQHDEIKEEYKRVYQQKVEVETKIKSIEELKSSVSGGIKCQHCGIELMNAAITNSKISELDKFLEHKSQLLGSITELTTKEQSFVQLKKEFDEYEKNKLIKEKYELNIESINLKIDNLKTKIIRYNELQDKIKENEKKETLIIKAGIKLDELEFLKNSLIRKIESNTGQINSLKEKIESNLRLIKKIQEESEKEKIYKIYLEIYGKNGISKLIMKNMLPLINSELQRLLQDSSHFRLEIRINDKNEVEFIMIDNNTQVEKLMSSGSGYERTIASLALRSVLTKICSLPKPNIVVMDEVFGKISNDNLDMVGEFFTKIKEYFEKIFLISHNPLINNWADNVIKIKKIDNISSVSQ